jgi:hypothetical protein
LVAVWTAVANVAGAARSARIDDDAVARGESGDMVINKTSSRARFLSGPREEEGEDIGTLQ